MTAPSRPANSRTQIAALPPAEFFSHNRVPCVPSCGTLRLRRVGL